MLSREIMRTMEEDKYEIEYLRPTIHYLTVSPLDEMRKLLAIYRGRCRVDSVESLSYGPGIAEHIG